MGKRTAEQRFFEKVNKDGPNGCWEWTAALNGGYGVFRDRNKLVGAHRFSYQYSNGGIPNGMLVCHSCDNPKCVNPDHLWLGTQRDNIKDCVSKGRHSSITCPESVPRGDRHKSITCPESVPRGDRHYLHLNPEKILLGEKCHCSKLTSKIVRMSREEFKAGVSVKFLANKWGVTYEAMYAVIHKKSWKHVK